MDGWVLCPTGEGGVARTAFAPPSAGELAADEVLVAPQHVVLARDVLDRVAPFAPGAAGVGLVVAHGAAASDLAGRRVAFGGLMACAECDACRRGRLDACGAATRLGVDRHGALASHVRLRRRWLTPLDGALAAAAPGAEAALLGGPAALAYALATRAGVAAGDVVLWLGDAAVIGLGRALSGWLGAHAPALALPAGSDVAAWEHAVRAALGAAAAPPPCAYRVLVVGAVDAQVIAPLAAAGALIGWHGGGASFAALGPALAAGARLGAACFGLGAPHPDLVPEVTALVGRGALALAPHATVLPLAELGQAALRALPAGQSAIVAL